MIPWRACLGHCEGLSRKLHKTSCFTWMLRSKVNVAISHLQLACFSVDLALSEQGSGVGFSKKSWFWTFLEKMGFVNLIAHFQIYMWLAIFYELFTKTEQFMLELQVICRTELLHFYWKKYVFIYISNDERPCSRITSSPRPHFSSAPISQQALSPWGRFKKSFSLHGCCRYGCACRIQRLHCLSWRTFVQIS